jgi:hypothetical protein
LLQNAVDDGDDVVERGAFGSLAGGGDRGHGIGVHEGVGAVQRVEGHHQSFERRAVRCACTGPRCESHPVAEPARQVEQVDRSLVAELGDGVVERAVEIRQIRRDVITAQPARQSAAVREDLVGQLSPQHQVVGEPLARHVLGQRVEGFDAGRGEREQVTGRAAFDDVSPCRSRARAIATIASSAATSHGSPTPTATGRDAAATGTTGRCSCAPR